MMYKHPWDIDSITVDGTKFNKDDLRSDFEILGKESNNEFIFRYNNQKYNIFLEYSEDNNNRILARTRGRTFEVTINTAISNLLEELGFNSITSVKDSQLYAPMPGLVLKTLVSVGQKVSEGEPLLTLEAMKMENVIKATRDGVISEMPNSDGDKVDKGDILIVFAEDLD